MRFLVVPIGFAVAFLFLGAALIIFWPVALIIVWIELIFLVAYQEWRKDETEKRLQFEQFLARPRDPVL